MDDVIDCRETSSGVFAPEDRRAWFEKGRRLFEEEQGRFEHLGFDERTARGLWDYAQNMVGNYFNEKEAIELWNAYRDGKSLSEESIEKVLLRIREALEEWLTSEPTTRRDPCREVSPDQRDAVTDILIRMFRIKRGQVTGEFPGPPIVVFGNEEKSQPEVGNQEIKFGKEQQLDEAEIKLPTIRFDLIREFIDSHSSGGENCVPLATACLALIRRGIANKGEQERFWEAMAEVRKRGVCREKPTPTGEPHVEVYEEGKWLDFYRAPAFLLGLERTNTSRLWKEGYFYAGNDGAMEKGGWGSLDKFSEIIELAREKDAFTIDGYEYSGHPVILMNVATEEGLRGVVVYSNENNPYFQRFPHLYKAPGEQYVSAGHHALLLIDFDKKSNFYFLDPQTGVVFSVIGSDLKEFGFQRKVSAGLGCIAHGVFTGKIKFKEEQ